MTTTIYWKVYKHPAALLIPILVKNNMPENIINYVMDHFQKFPFASKLYISRTLYENNISSDWEVSEHDKYQNIPEYKYLGALNTNLRKLKLLKINSLVQN